MAESAYPVCARSACARCRTHCGSPSGICGCRSAAQAATVLSAKNACAAACCSASAENSRCVRVYKKDGCTAQLTSVTCASAALSAAKGGTPPAMYTTQEIQQRAAMVLQDVHYVIDCHFELTDKAATGDNAGKFQDILRRRLAKGQCYHTPYFGCREFPVSFREWQGGAIPAIELTQDLGWMLYDMDYSNPNDIKAQFFRARLDRGVLDCRRAEVHT